MRANPNDEALKRALAWFEQKPGYEHFCAWLTYRLQGVKAKAAPAAAAFAESLDALPLDVRIDRLRTLGKQMLETGNPPGFMPYPIAMACARIAESWAAAAPEAAEPVCWRAVVINDPMSFEDALARDPRDPWALKAVIGLRIQALEQACHHLGEGRLIGTLEAARALTVEARTLMDRQAVADQSPAQAAALATLDSLVEAFATYTQAQPDLAFADWMQARGTPIPRTDTVYFRG